MQQIKIKFTESVLASRKGSRERLKTGDKVIDSPPPKGTRYDHIDSEEVTPKKTEQREPKNIKVDAIQNNRQPETMSLINNRLSMPANQRG